MRGLICSSFLATIIWAGAAHAKIPMFNANCPQGIDVHADNGGPIYINGRQANLRVFNDKYYEARSSGVTISLSINPDGSPSVSYTGSNRANGVCQVVGARSGGGFNPDAGGNTGAFNIRGYGNGTLGGPLIGQIVSRNGRSYALILTATRDGFTCTGSFNRMPDGSAMSTRIHCTNGANGSAILKGNLLTFSAGGKGGLVRFR